MQEQNIKRIFKYALLFVLCVVLIIFAVWRYELIFDILGKVVKVIRPIIIGGAIAFILNAFVNKFIRIFKKSKLSPKHQRIISIIAVYLIFIGLIVAIVWFVFPQLGESLSFFVSSFETYYNNFVVMAENWAKNIDLSMISLTDVFSALSGKLSEFGENLPQLLEKTFNFTSNLVGGVTDIFIGLIFSLYIIFGKDTFKRQISLGAKAFLSEDGYKNAVEIYRLSSTTFASFISGQLTEALILGVLCFIGMCIFGFEYALLISVIIGITNLIPIFGPIIGTIPCAFILLLVNPIHALWFVVFIVVLQQIESQLIYPHVVGTSVGLKPFWTLFAILIGGGLFGVIGMLIAVPTMSIIYTLVGGYVTLKLRDKGIPVEKEEKEEKPKKKAVKKKAK
ncbi:MAG: AI-2E family transporter [Ruminococcus sp.]|nr:AI-2E family transporter [Ruminococcus sp.]